jgi:hypothetical protein
MHEKSHPNMLSITPMDTYKKCKLLHLPKHRPSYTISLNSQSINDGFHAVTEYIKIPEALLLIGLSALLFLIPRYLALILSLQFRTLLGLVCLVLVAFTTVLRLFFLEFM